MTLTLSLILNVVFAIIIIGCLFMLRSYRKMTKYWREIYSNERTRNYFLHRKKE